MSLSAIIFIGFAVLTVIGVLAIVQHHLIPRDRRTPKGSEPGQGYHLVFAKERLAFFGPGNEDAAGRVTRIPKDPQEYAKAFVPGKLRQESKR